MIKNYLFVDRKDFDFDLIEQDLVELVDHHDIVNHLLH